MTTFGNITGDMPKLRQIEMGELFQGGLKRKKKFWSLILKVYFWVIYPIYIVMKFEKIMSS